MKKLSIIIPTFNSEKTIKRCLDSILSSPVDEIEVIVIDDFSTDNTVKILKEQYVNKIVLLENKENHGPSFSRNRGIKASEGEFISFVDSDDYVSPNYVKCLLSLIKENNDIVFFNYVNNHHKLACFPKKRNMQLLYLMKRQLFGYTWNKIFKRKILIQNNIFFDEGLKMCEDQLLTFEYIKYCEQIKFLPEKIYFYNLENNSSLSRKKQTLETYCKIYAHKKNFFVSNHLLDTKNGRKIFADYCASIYIATDLEKNSIIYQDLRKYKRYVSLRNKLVILYKSMKKKEK